jgi:hypothetical protein
MRRGIPVLPVRTFVVWTAADLPFTLLFYKRHIPEELPSEPLREPRIPHDMNILRCI